jgi:hypothetical protein
MPARPHSTHLHLTAVVTARTSTLHSDTLSEHRMPKLRDRHRQQPDHTNSIITIQLSPYRAGPSARHSMRV